MSDLEVEAIMFYIVPKLDNEQVNSVYSQSKQIVHFFWISLTQAI